jgi:hypothetical protein
MKPAIGKVLFFSSLLESSWRLGRFEYGKEMGKTSWLDTVVGEIA